MFFSEYRFAKRSAPRRVNPSAGEKVVNGACHPPLQCAFSMDSPLRVGVRNLFDDPPPFADNVAGYPVPLEDPRQRFIFFDVEKKF